MISRRRESAATLMPAIPGILMIIDAIPLNALGKVDRKQLLRVSVELLGGRLGRLNRIASPTDRGFRGCRRVDAFQEESKLRQVRHIEASIHWVIPKGASRMKENSSRFADMARERYCPCLRRGRAARSLYREPQGYLACCCYGGLLESGDPANKALYQRLGFGQACHMKDDCSSPPMIVA